MTDADLIVGDCLDVMSGMETHSIDAIVTDPPYCSGAIGEAQRMRASGQGLRSENIRRFGWFTGDNMGTAGLAFLLRAVAVQASRIVKPTGSFVTFCDWRMIATIQPAIESAGLRFQGFGVWDKGSMGLGRGFRHTLEVFLHFTFGEPEYYDAGVSNVLRAPRIRADEREHQTQKPVDLLRPIVRVVAPPDGVVLDPFARSGSTLVAARLEGRHGIGIERDPDVVGTARGRLALETTAKLGDVYAPSPGLFGGAP